MKKIALFPGSFDPFTNGHLDVARRGAALFDEVIIAVGHNSAKQRYLPLPWLLAQLEALFADEPRIRVLAYEGLTADLARRLDARFLLRGLRNTLDFEYENAIAQGNRYRWPALETVFLPPAPALAALSSTIIRDLHRHGADVSALVPFALPPAPAPAA